METADIHVPEHYHYGDVPKPPVNVTLPSDPAERVEVKITNDATTREEVQAPMLPPGSDTQLA